MTDGHMVQRKTEGPLLLLLGTLALFAWGCFGCSPTPSPYRRASAEWSRGRLLGTAALNNQPALQEGESGDTFVAWIGLDHELRLARLNDRAEVVVQRALDLDTRSPQKPRLLRDPTGQLHLLWMDTWEQEPQLFYARLSGDGQVLQQATAVSPPGTRVAHSSMVLAQVGHTVELFWSGDTPTHSGCYHATLDLSGQLATDGQPLIMDCLWPAAQGDRKGLVHLAWRAQPESDNTEFHYAIYDPRRRELGPDAVVARPTVQASLRGGPTAGAAFDGPWLGLDSSLVYVGWVVEIRERAEVMASTFYQSFPQPVLRASTEYLEYSPPEVVGVATQVQGADPRLTNHPAFLEGQPTEQRLACFTQVSGRAGRAGLQIAVATLQGERIVSQEIVSATPAASMQPNIAVDSEGYLHLVWIDTAGFRRYGVVYASTAPPVRQALNRTTIYDVTDAVLGGMMSMLSSLIFVPVALAWSLVPIAWLVGFAVVTGRTESSEQHALPALAVSMFLQLVSKLLFSSELLAQFAVVGGLSSSLSLLLGRWILPPLLAGVSAGSAWVYLRRGRSRSIFVAYLVYLAVDTLLTLAIYVAPLMG